MLAKSFGKKTCFKIWEMQFKNLERIWANFFLKKWNILIRVNVGKVPREENVFQDLKSGKKTKRIVWAKTINNMSKTLFLKRDWNVLIRVNVGKVPRDVVRHSRPSSLGQLVHQNPPLDEKEEKRNVFIFLWLSDTCGVSLSFLFSKINGNTGRYIFLSHKHEEPLVRPGWSPAQREWKNWIIKISFVTGWIIFYW